MTIAPIDLVAAHPWRRVAFTTYALSLSFFEAVVLDALVRTGGSAQPVILADVEGVRESLSEQGAHRVGKDYDVEPVVVTGGVFHPKISVLWSDDECHMLVGSGNLTFNGWGGNCEVLEHLHASFASDALGDAADFFEKLPATKRVRHGAAEHCEAIAAGLRRAVKGRPQNRDIRLLHNLTSPIDAQLTQIVGDLGGALRIVAAAPFWDGGVAIDRLCQTLGVNEAFIHAHAKGAVQGRAGFNWPRNARTTIQAVRVAALNEDTDADRLLHAKMFEILCRRGRVLVSGSANGTSAALGPNANVEACLVRIQRDRRIGWSFVAAEPPDPQPKLEGEEGRDERRVGVLRAVLDADDVTGHVLTPRMNGQVSVFHVGPTGPELLAETTLGAGASFRITAPDLEKSSWRGGRLVLRVRDSQARESEGFVSVSSFAEIARRGGIVTRRLFALVTGTESPEDVAAILNWFWEDPHRLVADPLNSRRAGIDAENEEPDRLIPIAALAGDYSDVFVDEKAYEGRGSRNWSRFMDQILSAFREPRGPFGGTDAGSLSDDEDEDVSTDSRREQRERDPGLDRAYASFERLFELLTRDGSPARNAVIAFELTGYICDRLRPDPVQVQGWLKRTINALLVAGVPTERRNDVAAGILTLVGSAPTLSLVRWARGCLLRLGGDVASEAPSVESVRGYRTVLQQQESWSELWERVRAVRTFPEQVASYLRALDRGEPAVDAYPDLPTEARGEWSTLEAAFTSKAARQQLLIGAKGSPDACPIHHMKLPAKDIHQLQSIGIATAKNCCRKIIILEGA